MNAITVFDFSEEDDWSNWEIENDRVMGGRSTAELVRTDMGNALFKGSVSLENNGGFASVQYRFSAIEVSQYSNAVLRLKGDGKRYQFRVKADLNDRYSFIQSFETTGDWQTITIPLKKMYPVYRGRDVNRPNFDADQIEEVRFLIGNNKWQDFALEIDKIMLE
jgi:hypothetical protein